jgi:uncharacterized protein (TIGR04255 family)
LVVCQVRYDRNLAAADASVAWSIKSDVSATFPEIEEAAPEITLPSGVAGLQIATGSARGWRLRSSDAMWTATVTPESMSVETSRYENWTDFRHRLRLLLDAISAHLHPTFEHRLGLRYVDRLTHQNAVTPSDWNGRIVPPLLGLLADERFADAVRVSQHVEELTTDDDVQVVLRYGHLQQTDASVPSQFLLDTDCFRSAMRPFTVDEVLQGVDQLHTLALQLFEAALTPEYLDYLGQALA